MNYEITILSIGDSGDHMMPIMTTEIIGIRQTMSVSKERADKLRGIIGKAMPLEKFAELCSIPDDLLDAEDLSLD